jgi:hypothetical protein
MSESRDNIITYTIRDGQGMLRGQGIPSEAMARAAAQALADDTIIPMRFDVERVTFSSTTKREPVGSYMKAELP